MFNVLAGVAHSLAMWPQPWHLKHCSAVGVPGVVGTILGDHLMFGCSSLPWGTVFTQLAVEELQAEVVWPRPFHPLWELGQVGVFLSICPLPWPLYLGLFGALTGQLPCSALVRVAINLTIWLSSSFECHPLHFSGCSRPTPDFVFGLLCLAFCFVGCDHQLGVGGLRYCCVNIWWSPWCSYRSTWNSTILEVPCHLAVSYLSGEF